MGSGKNGGRGADRGDGGHHGNKGDSDAVGGCSGDRGFTAIMVIIMKKIRL